MSNVLYLTIRNRVFDISIYLVVAFAILIPFLFGKLFLLDFVPAMNKNFDLLYGRVTTTYGGALPIDIMLILTSIDILQKILFFIILFLSGYMMYNLMKKMIPSRLSSFYAGLLYMINPYVYIKMISGQWFFLFPYAIFPLLLKIFIDLLGKKETKEMTKFTFLLSIVAFNIHMLIIALIIMTIIFIFWLNKHRDIRIIKILLTTAILFTLLNSYWIIPVLTAKNTVVANIGNKDYEVFAPKGGLFDIASMHGFWLEGYLYSRDFLPGWQILYLIILSLTILGFIYYYKDQKIGIYVKAFAVIGILGFILASGVNGPFGDIVRWLFDNTLLKGFRDSQKFVAMLVLAYSVLGGLGLNKIKNVYDKYNQDEEMP